MQPIENKMTNRVYGYGRDWAFIKNDFLDLGRAYDELILLLDALISSMSEDREGDDERLSK